MLQTAIEKEASHLRESATDIDEAMHEIEHFLQRLRALAVEVRGYSVFPMISQCLIIAKMPYHCKMTHHCKKY